MRYLFTLAAVATAVQLSAGVASAQYEPASYSSLLGRIEQLEANQGLSDPNACSDGGLYFQYDNVIVKPFLSENSAFPAQDEDGNISNQGFDFDLEYSPRIEVGYLSPTSKLGFRARYWHFETDASAGPANDSNGLIANDAVGVAVGATIQDVDTITSVVFDLDMDVLDLEAIHTTGIGNFSAGVRLAQIGQNYNLDSDEGQLITDLDVTGIGPTLAYEWKSRCFWFDGLSCLANIRGSLLYGDKNVDSDGPDSDYLYDESSLICNVDAQIGMEYRRASGLFLRAAFEAQYWANTGNATNQNVGPGDDTGDNEFVSGILDDDLGFLGMVFAVGYEF